MAAAQFVPGSELLQTGTWKLLGRGGRDRISLVSKTRLGRSLLWLAALVGLNLVVTALLYRGAVDQLPLSVNAGPGRLEATVGDTTCQISVPAGDWRGVTIEIQPDPQPIGSLALVPLVHFDTVSVNGEEIFMAFS